MSLISSFFQADLFGKFIYLLLFFLSFISWIVLIQKILMVRVILKKSESLHAFFIRKSECFLQLDKESVEKIEHPYKDLFFSLKNKTLELLNKNRYFSNPKKDVFLSAVDVEHVASHCEVTVALIIKRIEKNLFVLPTVVTLAPFLGLLGTVWGIYLTFNQISSGYSLSNLLVLKGISMALITTVLGLLVAIPALIAHNYIRNALKDLTKEMLAFSHAMISKVQIQYQKVDDRYE